MISNGIHREHVLFPGCLLALLAIAVTGQIHVRSYLESERVQHLSAGGSALPDEDTFTEGDPDSRRGASANKDSTASSISESIGSLLRTWGNTQRRNGQ